MLGLLPNMETVERIDADHRQMAKCPSRSCPQYQAILGVLKAVVRAVPPGGDALTLHIPGSLLPNQAPVEAALPAAG